MRGEMVGWRIDVALSSENHYKSTLLLVMIFYKMKEFWLFYGSLLKWSLVDGLRMKHKCCQFKEGVIVRKSYLVLPIVIHSRINPPPPPSSPSQFDINEDENLTCPPFTPAIELRDWTCKFRLFDTWKLTNTHPSSTIETLTNPQSQ